MFWILKTREMLEIVQNFSMEEGCSVMYIQIYICICLYLCIKLDRYMSVLQLNLKILGYLELSSFYS